MEEAISDGHFTVTWKNINYYVERGMVDTIISRMAGQQVEKRQKILDNVQGCVRSGQMSALMGPSGAGKTTLLECLIGKRETGLSGAFEVRGARQLRMAIIPQHECLQRQLTVIETLKFAYAIQEHRLRNLDIGGSSSKEKIITGILTQFDLNDCAQNGVDACSGSERKRLSIAVDIISKPNLIMQDEPTTGLDSVAALELCRMLKRLSRDENNKICVLMTIHQPSQHVFFMFDQVYMLSNQTKTSIYEGTPKDVVDHLSKFGYDCPPLYNPSDFLIEVAAGKYGNDGLNDLNTDQKRHFDEVSENQSQQVASTLQSCTKQNQSFPFLKQLLILMARFTLCNFLLSNL